MIFCQLARWVYAMGLLSFPSCQPLQILHQLKPGGNPQGHFLPLVLESREGNGEQRLTVALTVLVRIKSLLCRKSHSYLDTLRPYPERLQNLDPYMKKILWDNRLKMEKTILLSGLLIRSKLLASLFAGLGLGENKEGIRLIRSHPRLQLLFSLRKA